VTEPGDGAAPSPEPGTPTTARRVAPALARRGSARLGLARRSLARPSLARPGLARPGSGSPEWALAVATLARAGYGAALCCAPGPMLRVEGGPGAAASPGARAVARILGGRHIVQAVLSATRPTPAVLAAGAATDVLHAASMIALAALDPPRRRLGLSDSLIAAAFAASGWALASRGRAALVPAPASASAPPAAALPSLP
jgi:hypothetical protein